MASPPTASPKTRSRSASSRASTTRSASSSAAPTVYATRNICGSRCSHACFQRFEVAKNTHTTSRRPLFQYLDNRRAVGEDHVGRQRHQFLCILPDELNFAIGPPVFDVDV